MIHTPVALRRLSSRKRIAGDVYYFNKRTGVTTWDKPECLKARRRPSAARPAASASLPPVPSQNAQPFPAAPPRLATDEVTWSAHTRPSPPGRDQGVEGARAREPGAHPRLRGLAQRHPRRRPEVLLQLAHGGASTRRRASRLPRRGGAEPRDTAAARPNPTLPLFRRRCAGTSPRT